MLRKPLISFGEIRFDFTLAANLFAVYNFVVS